MQSIILVKNYKMITFNNYKDIDGNEIIIKLSYHTDFVPRVGCVIYKETKLKIPFFRHKTKLVRVYDDYISIYNLTNLDVVELTSFAEKTLEEYNYSLQHSRRLEKFKNLFSD